MKRYVVKSTSVASETNQSCKGEIHVWWHGKGEAYCGKLIFHKDWTDGNGLYDWEAKNYGYTRRCDAKRSYLYKHPQNDSNWSTVVEIVEVEV